MRLGIFGLLAVALLAALWLWLRPAPSAPAVVAPAAALQASAPQMVEVAPEPAPRRFSLAVPAAPGTDGVLRVQQGESVELIVTSAEDDELHLHGYDLALKLRAGMPATLTFTAEHAGRFEIELHHRHAEIGALEVSPR